MAEPCRGGGGPAGIEVQRGIWPDVDQAGSGSRTKAGCRAESPSFLAGTPPLDPSQ